MITRMHADEIPLDEQLVRRLVREQFPHLARLPLSLAATGTVNALYRLGDSMVQQDETTSWPRWEADGPTQDAWHVPLHEGRLPGRASPSRSHVRLRKFAETRPNERRNSPAFCVKTGGV